MTQDTNPACPYHWCMVKIVAGRGVPRGAIGLLAWAREATPFNESEAKKWNARNDSLIAEGKPALYGWRVGLDMEGTGERVWTFAHNLEAV